MPQSIRNAQSSRAANQASSRFLCVLRVLAVKVLSRINRQDAKSAKKSAKKNSFQAAKDFRVSSTEQPSHDQNRHFSESRELVETARRAVSTAHCLPRKSLPKRHGF